MGTWDSGPFDNDSAADWSDDLHEAEPEHRPAMIRDAFAAVLEEGGGYLDSSFATEAIAAAALVAAQHGGPAVDSVYAPDFFVAGERIDLPADIVPMAISALDRIVAENSEWYELWADSGALDDAMGRLEPIRAALARVTQATGTPAPSDQPADGPA